MLKPKESQYKVSVHCNICRCTPHSVGLATRFEHDIAGTVNIIKFIIESNIFNS